MAGKFVHCGRVVATIAFLGFFAFPAEATELEKVRDLCLDALENHPGDSEWEQLCLDALAQLELEMPEGPPHTPVQPPPSRLFPIAQTEISEGPHDGDRLRIAESLRSGEAVDIIVEFEVSAVRNELHARALEEGRKSLSPSDLEEKRAGYTAIKQRGLEGLGGITVLLDYDNLASSFVRVDNEDALYALIARSEVKSVYENAILELNLAQSLPLIQQPAAAAIGKGGAGTTIAVLDTGVNYTIAPFNCTSPGVPAGCRVVATYEAAPNDSSLDADGHGTNVSAIAASTAGDADLVVADVFTGSQAFPLCQGSCRLSLIV